MLNDVDLSRIALKLSWLLIDTEDSGNTCNRLIVSIMKEETDRRAAMLIFPASVWIVLHTIVLEKNNKNYLFRWNSKRFFGANKFHTFPQRRPELAIQSSAFYHGVDRQNPSGLFR